MPRKSKKQIFISGLIDENPLLVLILGICPAIMFSASAVSGLRMGICTAIVLTCSNIIISALKRVIPEQVRIPCYITIIAAFVTLLQMLMQAYMPETYEALSGFLPYTIVNCLVLGRAEAFASRNSVADSAVDGISMGLGYMVTITIASAVRELFGTGAVFGLPVLSNLITPMSIFVLAPGGFFVIGCLIALLTKLAGSRICADKADDTDEGGQSL
jgi:electron transport complex protein RnfE